MHINDFDREFYVWKKRVFALNQGSDELPISPQELIKQISLQLETAWEELQVAHEELHQQNEQLEQQNQELMVALALAQSQRQRYLDLFEQAPDGYLVTNVAGTISEANRAAAKLLNVEPRFLVGKPLSIFFPKEVRQTLISKLNSICSVDFATEWEVSLIPRNKPPIDVAISVACVRASSGEVVDLRWLLRDLSERKRSVELEQEIAVRQQVESQLRHSSLHDPLTGLPNRTLFIQRLKDVLEYSKQHSPDLFAVLFIDLDCFKLINDSLGHSIGDQLLIATAKRLLHCLRPTDTAARLGGDEFTILLRGIRNINEVISVAERLQTELKLPLTLDQQKVFTSASIGIALSADNYDRTEDLLRDADTAMYRAKSLGGARTEIFSSELHVQAVVSSQLETELRQALARLEFQIYYQPIVALDTCFLVGFEALVRWQHPQRGLLSPGDFLPLARELGLSIALDRWVLTTACRQIAQWQQQYSPIQPLTISVNVCSLNLPRQDIVADVNEALNLAGLDARYLRLELTETVIMESIDRVITQLTQLRTLGIELLIDDFGTGYSSLARLHNFPISGLKIDRSFVSGSSANEGNLDIISTIVTLAKKLGVNAIAEGVETIEQLALLKQLKCEYGQGYFFSKPLDAAAAEALIASTPPW